MNRRFVGKTVVITGASSGIGAVAARRFYHEGASIVLVARGQKGLWAAVEGLDPDRILLIPADISKVDEAALILDKAQAHFGRIDALVNSVVVHARGRFEFISTADIIQMVDVNLRGPMVLYRLCLPYLAKAKRGSIVNVGSLAGVLPVAGAAVYSATKSGLRAFSLALAEELRGTGITVSVVCPGPVYTQRVMRDLDLIPDISFSIPMADPEDVAEVIVSCAYDGRPERTIPRIGGFLAATGALLPSLRRRFVYVFALIGGKRKASIKRRLARKGTGQVGDSG